MSEIGDCRPRHPIVGRLPGDPVLRPLSDEHKVRDMRLAVNDQRDQPPMFIDGARFGASAEACGQYLAKGRTIAVTGRHIYREQEADDCTRRSKYQDRTRRFGGHPDDAPTNSEDAADCEEKAF